MVTRVKGSVWTTEDNVGAVSARELGQQNTDITVAMSNALLAGKPIFIPIGQWIIGSLTVPANSLIYGMGERSILKQKDLANSPAITVGDNTTLRDFTVDGNKINQVGTGFHGFVFQSSVDTQAFNLFAVNNKGCGYKVTGINTQELTLTACAVIGHTESGISVDAGGHVSLFAPRVAASDNTATGDGISIASAGTVVANIIVDSPTVRSQAGRGIALIGNGAKNVVAISVSNPRIEGGIGHGIHVMNSDGVTVIGGDVNANSGDGIRVEGDVQNSRFVSVVCRNNIGFAAREVTLVSTPNFNGFIYIVPIGNGNNTVTKVGANSYVV